MATFKYILSIPVTSIGSAALTGALQAINSGGLPNACESLIVSNQSDTAVTISFDGTNNHNVIPANGSLSVVTPSGLRNAWRSGTVVYATGTAGVGTIYLSGKYIAS